VWGCGLADFSLFPMTPNILVLLLRGNHACDLHHCIRLAMAVPSPHVLAPAKLLNDDFLGSELIDDLRYDLRPVEGRTADHRSPACASKQQNLRKNEFVPGISVPAIDSDSIAFSHTKLVTAVLNNCVHPFEAPRRRSSQ
jgi:hypothetical protein